MFFLSYAYGFWMGENGRFLLNLMWWFEIPWPRALTFFYLVLTGGLYPGAFLKAAIRCVAVICWWILLALNQLVFIILFISRRVTHQACLLIAADLVLLTPTSVNLKRPNEKKSYERITFQALKPSHYSIIAL